MGLWKGMPAFSSAVRYLRDYVAIPSLNPMGRNDIDPLLVGERHYAERVLNDLVRLGVSAVLVGQRERPSVVAELRVPDAIDTLMIASHLDTVPVDGMTIPPFDPVVEQGQLYGRGACDTKAGMAALLAALERVLAQGTLRRNVIVVGEADEEMASAGVRDVLAHLAGRSVDWVLATEPTSLRVVTSHKGRASLKLEATGRAGHSSDPDRADNALLSLSRAVLSLDQLHRELAARPHAQLGPATLAVTMMSGGQAPNVVPDTGCLLACRRTLPGETLAQIRAEVEQALAHGGLTQKVRVSAAEVDKEPLGTPDDHAAVRACQGALAGTGLPIDTCGVAFATDAGPLAEQGIPGIVMGPGDIALAHTARECVAVEEVDAMARFFERLLRGESC